MKILFPFIFKWASRVHDLQAPFFHFLYSFYECFLTAYSKHLYRQWSHFDFDRFDLVSTFLGFFFIIRSLKFSILAKKPRKTKPKKIMAAKNCFSMVSQVFNIYDVYHIYVYFGIKIIIMTTLSTTVSQLLDHSFHTNQRQLSADAYKV